MARVSNNLAGRGLTHIIEIDLDDYKETSGNADITVTLLSSTGNNPIYVSRCVVFLGDEIPTAGGNAISVEVGKTGATDALATSIDVTGESAGIVAMNSGPAFYDGVTQDTVNGYNTLGDAVVAVLHLNAGNWSDTNGASIFVGLDALDIAEFI